MKRRILSIIFTFAAAVSAFAQSATITGTVSDGDVKGEFLAGTSIVVLGTTKGTIADANGSYTIFVPTGKQTIQAYFLGYKTQEIEVNLKAGEVKVLNIEMHADGEVLEGVVVSAQAKGQQAAINKQINASGIMNAVSEEKLRELPDVNVAEAIGRLPGLMIERDGGEGQKIVIRGLDPKYNTVAINGMNAPSTSSTDRSTDLNMISPDMIAGAEVLKANTADKDADGLGGTINLVMKDAPKGLRMNVTSETGYHSQINGIGRAKAGVMASNRFFKDKFGVIFAAGYDRTDRSNDTFSAGYHVSGNTKTPGYNYTRPELTVATVAGNQEVRTRYNANLNFDFDLGSGNKIKVSNIFSRLERDREECRKRYGISGNRLQFRQADINSYTSNLSNLLQGDFNILGSTLNIGAGQSIAWMGTPWNNEMEFRADTPYGSTSLDDLSDMRPYDAIAYSEATIDDYYLYYGHNDSSKSKERELTAWLDWKTPFSIGNSVSGYVKAGGKYRRKDRSHDVDNYYRRFDLSKGFTEAQKNMPELSLSPAKEQTFGIADFLDNNYSGNDTFLRGYYPNCYFDFKLNSSFMKEFYEKNSSLYYKLWQDTIREEYSGNEEIYAAYIMGEINVGKWLTFIPGFRYDYTTMKYNALSGSNVSASEDTEATPSIEETEDSQSFGYLLPQFHLRIKPLEWMDIRLAYTQTLSRPDYNDLAPRTIIYPTSYEVDWSRTNLKPALSRNYDVTLSFYPQNWGLFTVSAFHKNISNFLYTRTAAILEDTMTDPSDFGLSSAYGSFQITYPLNSPTHATITGLEAEAQVNFHHLQNFMKGFVLSVNLSWMNSSMDYQTTHIEMGKNPNGGFVPITINSDVAYTDRLLKQPTWLANFSVGYDHKKFSARISGNFQDGVLVTAQQRDDAADKEITAPYFKLDAQCKYSLTKKLSFYANWSNITCSLDKKIRYVTGYPIKTEYYGTTAYIGIKYDIFK